MSIVKFVSPVILPLLFGAVLFGCASTGGGGVKWTSAYNEADGFYVITNPQGKTLSVSGLDKIITVKGLAFKDLNGNGKLDPYEDWRLSPEDRAKDIVKKLTAENPIDRIAPLMLASYHFGMRGPISGDLAAATNITGSSSAELIAKGMRTVLNAAAAIPTSAQVEWMNAMQKAAESDARMMGIPVNVMSDPRSNAGASDGVYDGSASTVSKWPGSLGFGATFNPDYVEQFGKMASREYRALGITTALSPQIDLATEPRWQRASGTYGESSLLTADIALAYTRGFQSTYSGDKMNWGDDSVAVMLKHWPGDGAGEAGRESHGNGGKYAVFPGGNLEEHFVPFARALDKSNKNTTLYASSIMPSYSIGLDKDGKPVGGDPQPLGSGVSPFKISETLFGRYNFEGYVCTDWGVSGTILDDGDGIKDSGGGMAWGTGNLPGPERVWAGLKVGIDMYGGLDSPNAIREAYKLAVTNLGEAKAAAQFADSVRRILLSFFRLGIFENPYRSAAESEAIVGAAEFAKAGYEAQLASIVMLKNRGNVIAPYANKKTVYIPLKVDAKTTNDTVLDNAAAKAVFNVVTDTLNGGQIARRSDFSGVDFALVKAASPANVSFSMFGSNVDPEKRNVPGDVEITGMFGLEQHAYRPNLPIDNGYNPKTLQYGPYYADPAVVRKTPIGLDPAEEQQWIAAGQNAGQSRYYGGKTITSANSGELALILDTVSATGGRVPVVVAIAAQSAMVFNEFENRADAIVLAFGTSDAAIIDIVSGKREPGGLLPIQMPINMAAVEKQLEDVPFDLECHQDTEGNVYDFGFGLSWNGVITDNRTARYVRK